MNENLTDHTDSLPMLDEIESKVIASMGKYADAKFRPFAYYDEHLDCIRVLNRDCSVCENRIDDIFTVLEDNYPQYGQPKYVGFTIKGIRNNLKKAGIHFEKPHVMLTEILDFIVNNYPEGTVDLVVSTIARPMVEYDQLSVDLPDDLVAQKT